jgi:hypothetical protein
MLRYTTNGLAFCIQSNHAPPKHADVTPCNKYHDFVIRTLTLTSNSHTYFHVHAEETSLQSRKICFFRS